MLDDWAWFRRGWLTTAAPVQAPRFDHIFGVFKTRGGSVRRLDMVLVPWDEWAFALVGWVGSRTFLRFLRQHARDLGMQLNSHRQAGAGGGGCCSVAGRPGETRPLPVIRPLAWGMST